MTENTTPLDIFKANMAFYESSNKRPAIDQPANDFEKAVNDWNELQELQEAVKDAMKLINTNERTLRDGLASSLALYFGDKLKEGTNNFTLSNGRKLKYTHKIERKITESELKNAKEAYATAADASDPDFDKLLRLKYELDKKAWDGITDQAAKAFSLCMTAKPAAPTLAVD